MKVVHLGTVVNSRFGLLDNEGNVVQEWNVGPNPNQPDVLQVRVLDFERFSDVHGALVQMKQQLQQQVDQEVLNSTETIDNLTPADLTEKKEE